MPGHFTHIYMARQVADWLSGHACFNPDDSSGASDSQGQGPASGSGSGIGIGPLLGGLGGLDPGRAGEVMSRWPKFTGLGAVGPDLFFYCQDYSNGGFTEHPLPDDLLMLAMGVVYAVRDGGEERMRPLLVLLAEANQLFAGIVRMMIKLESMWGDVVSVYNGSVDAIVSALAAAADDLTGGIVAQARVALDNVVNGVKRAVADEVASSDDFFAAFAKGTRSGWDERSFAWSDMLHYRKTSQMPRNLLLEAERQFELDGDEEKREQFQAFALGWTCHVGTDVIGHSFVNEQAGGPFRTHWQRHHVIENHMDAWIYRQAGAGGALPLDQLGADETYPDIGESALTFAIGLSGDRPEGWERPESLPEDASEVRKLVDLPCEMPRWLAEGIVRAMIATYCVPGEPQPENLGGDSFAPMIPSSLNALEPLLRGAGIAPETLDEPLDVIAGRVAWRPSADFAVPRGYPQPWELQVSYQFMLTYFRLAFWGGSGLAKPQRPSLVERPPRSGAVTGSRRARDTIRAFTSPASFGIRYALYEVAMWGWEMLSRAHNILAHTGFLLPHGERTYPGTGEMMLPNEIDLGLISLGSTVDPAFVEALDSSVRFVATLDCDAAIIGPRRDPRTRDYPYLPVRSVQVADGSEITNAAGMDGMLWSLQRPARAAPNEHQRPWAHPDISRRPDGSLYPTPSELSDLDAQLEAAGRLADRSAILDAGVSPAAGTLSGPYPAGARPEDVLFRTGRLVDPAERAAYENAVSPSHTDALNERLIGRGVGVDHSPLGDTIQFCGYLMGRILSPEGYGVDFNLDADRGYGYLCWDWIRGGAVAVDDRARSYRRPKAPPEGARQERTGTGEPAPGWAGAAPDAEQVPVQLRYLGVVEPEASGGERSLGGQRGAGRSRERQRGAGRTRSAAR